MCTINNLWFLLHISEATDADPTFSLHRYCGELSSLALTSNTNILAVRFHSDESYTDKGFSAEYSAYDPSNRESTILSNVSTRARCVKPVTLNACHYRARCLCWLREDAAAAEWYTNRVLALATELQRRAECNPRAPLIIDSVLTGSVLFSAVSQGTPHFQYSGLYVVSQFD